MDYLYSDPTKKTLQAKKTVVGKNQDNGKSHFNQQSDGLKLAMQWKSLKYFLPICLYPVLLISASIYWKLGGEFKTWHAQLISWGFILVQAPVMLAYMRRKVTLKQYCIWGVLIPFCIWILLVIGKLLVFGR